MVENWLRGLQDRVDERHIPNGKHPVCTLLNADILKWLMTRTNSFLLSIYI